MGALEPLSAILLRIGERVLAAYADGKPKKTFRREDLINEREERRLLREQRLRQLTKP